jgi:RNA polymerase sigma-70 factor, ECF subfamily
MVPRMPAGDDFAAVLQAARLGEEWAFSALYQTFNARVLRYFASRVPDVAEDLAAETWLGAARTLSSFEGGEQAFRAWIFTIAHRQLVQHWRDGARRPPADPGRANASAEDDQGIVAAHDVEVEAVDSLMARQAAQAIADSLTADQAEVVLLRVLGGLDVDDVARILGKRPGTVRALQHKALRKLATNSFFLEALTQ